MVEVLNLPLNSDDPDPAERWLLQPGDMIAAVGYERDLAKHVMLIGRLKAMHAIHEDPEMDTIAGIIQIENPSAFKLSKEFCQVHLYEMCQEIDPSKTKGFLEVGIPLHYEYTAEDKYSRLLIAKNLGSTLEPLFDKQLYQ